MAEKRDVVVIDPSMQYSRMLHYKEKHSGWEIFKALFWGIYILQLGMILMYSQSINLVFFIGYVLVSFAFSFIIYGFSSALHLRLMKRYA
ncbi:MAG: hypothetical protein ACP5TL_02270 [Candidatus Micrarchaeia archaeon]